MRLIPGKTKVQVELFKGVRLTDIFIGAAAGGMILLALTSSIPGKLYIALGLLLIAVVLIVRLDEEPNYLYLLHILRHFGYCRNYDRPINDKTLLRKNRSETDDAVDELYGEPGAKTETHEEYKARIRAEKAERKADDKILKSRKATKEEKDAIWLKRAKQSEAKKRAKQVKKGDSPEFSHEIDEITAFTGIANNLIEYGGKYYGAAIEIPAVEFRFFSPNRRNNSIEGGIGRILRTLPPEYAANIVKIEKTVLFDSYVDHEYDKLDTIRTSYEKGFITEQEMKARVEILYDRINDLRNMCDENKVVMPFYYIVLFDSDRNQLNVSVNSALETLRSAELDPHRLNTKELAVFLKYSNQLDFDEHEIDALDPADYAKWAMPQSVRIRYRTAVVNQIITHNMRIIKYPTVVGDAWLAGVMSMPATKVIVKCTPMDRAKSVRSIDFSLQELRAQYANTGVDSKRIELEEHIETLSNLLALLQGDNESLLAVNIYVTCYDINQTLVYNDSPELAKSSLSNIANLKRAVRRLYQESAMKLGNMEFEQMNAYIGSQISAWDPMIKQARGIPSNSVAAAYPWIYAHIADEKGIKLGYSDGVPVFIDFFRRDSERVNSNMVIVGKSGSGKSYAAKSLLTNLAADDSKIFILDPENEYTELAKNLRGKFINVGNAQFGRLNPFHINTVLDDEDEDGGPSGSYATHLQFLEEFFRQILPDCDKDAMEYLNSIIDRMYTNMGITADTDLSALLPEDYPVFDDLYDAILTEFQTTDNDYIRTMLRTLMNYVAKFSAGGRNANIWNGPSTVTTEENFTVFNFQSLLANRNETIANAQMLLVLKYIDNEIIKNRDYNLKYKMNRKIIVVIDEAHVFIDTKFPVALDFMFQLAKRIRKYNGMQIVITQNIKDFVGSEEIARKSTAIINACQYSFIFSLAPNDMGDLCRLYEKAGGINENEQEQIISAPRGQVFTVMSPQSRSTFKVTVPEDIVAMFQDSGFQSRYFRDEDGEANWEDFIGGSREIHERAKLLRRVNESLEEQEKKEIRSHVNFVEMTEEEARAEEETREIKTVPAITEYEEPDDFPDIPDIPDDPEEFEKMRNAVSRERAAQTPVQPQQQMQPVIPQVVVQAPAVSTQTEKMLTELLSSFSHDAMVEEIRRTVREEMEREFADRYVQKEEQTPTPAEEIRGEEPYTEAEEPKSAYEAETISRQQEPAEAKNSGFDIMAMLAMEAERMEETSPIDMMDTYGETVITITLEELIRYNRKH